MKIGVIGLGLIGGSVALSFRKYFPKVEIWGQDASAIHIEQALDLGLVTRKLHPKDWIQMDGIVIAIPVDATAKLLPEVLDAISNRTWVMDMGSTKEAIVQAVESHPKRAQFVAAHPIAGTEFSGPKAAFEGLFSKKVMLLCDTQNTDNQHLQQVIGILNRFEMRIISLDASSHDLHVAYVSHLSHVSSFMLGQTVLDMEKNREAIVELAGSGFASTVRLAKSSAAMWAPIFLENKTHVLNALHEYIAHLNTFASALEQNDRTVLLELMHKANEIKPILEGMTQNGNPIQ